MFWLDVVSRIVHVGTAVTLVGGSVFMLCVLMPSVGKLSAESRETLHTAVVGRWKRFVHGGVLLFLVSGLYNYIRAIPNHRGDGLYHALIGTKMLLALGIFFLAAALVGRSPKLQRIRANRKKWLSILVLMAAIIVAISGAVKIRGIPATDASVSEVTTIR